MLLLMIAQPRTGTVLLRDLLNRHSEIYIYGEILYPDLFMWGFFAHLLPEVGRDGSNLLPTRWSSHLRDYLDELTGIMSDAGKSVIGFDAKIPHVALLPNFHDNLPPDFAVLHVRRRNTLAAVLVWYELMGKRIAEGGASHATAPSKNISLQIDPAWLALRISEFETQDKWIKYIYGERTYLELWYEDFASPGVWDSARGRLSAFFGIDIGLPFAPKTVKQNSPNLADLIDNSAEIRSQFPQFF